MPAVADHDANHRCRASDLFGDVEESPTLRPEAEGKLLLLGTEVPMGSLHQRPPGIWCRPVHRNRCADRLNPPILKSAATFFGAELDRRRRR